MNKKNNLFAFFVLLASMISLQMSAHDIEVTNSDGAVIYYNWSGDGVSVTYKGSSHDEYTDEYAGNITIPSSISYNEKTYNVLGIGSWTFSGCKSLKSIKIPNSVTFIGDKAFQDCENLHTIELSNNVSTIGDYAFEGCCSLTPIDIPDEVVFIGMGAFSNCNNLTSTDIKNGVQAIGKWAFEDTNLRTIKIPRSVISIGEFVFSHCDNLVSIEVEKENPIYDSRNNCNAIIESSSNTLLFGCKTTLIPQSVRSIGNFAFVNCSEITSIDIREGIKEIGVGAFEGCSCLTSVIIPTTTTKIGGRAFSLCYNLTQIVCKSTVPPVIPFYDPLDIYSGMAFDSVDKSQCTLYVPLESVEAYKSAYEWNEFNIIGGMPTDIKSIHPYQEEDVKYYDLNGQRILSPKKGINIFKSTAGRAYKVYVK